MRNPRTSASLQRFLGALAAAAALILALGAGSAGAAAVGPFGIENFDGEVIEEGGEPATQAGSHPYEATIEFDVLQHEEEGFCLEPIFFVCEIPNQSMKDVELKLPVGFLGNPNAVPTCPLGDFARGVIFPGGTASCPPDSAIGTVVLRGNVAGQLPLPTLVYNLKPGPNEPAKFGFRAAFTSVPIHATIAVRPGGEYGLTTTIPDVSQLAPVVGQELRLWGVPGDPSHDEARGCGPVACGGGQEPIPFGGPVLPFLSNPTSCTGPVATTIRMNSWQEQGNYQEASFLSHNALDEPIGADGCDKVSFDPSLSLQSDPPSAATPTALSATLHVPQHNVDTEGLVSSHLKKAVVTLPQGVSVNTSAAAGLEGCSGAQVGLHANEPAHCPDASKIGTALITTPLLEDPLEGAFYLAEQNANPFGSLLAGYLVAEGHGVILKQAAKFDLDQSTGQLTATFEDTPQLQFSEVELAFFGGPRGGLVNPGNCGGHTYTSILTSWSGRTVNTTGSFAVDRNCSTGGFNPRLSAGTTNPVAGVYAPFVFNASRNDGEQNVAAIGAALPRGELAKLAGVPLCPEPNAVAGSCPVASQIGQLNVAVGAGPQPLWVPQPGKAPTAMYLAGPYKGEPLSVLFRVPAQAGPFDLSTVAVRAAVHIDPITAQVSVSSDPLPQILQGVPIDYRQILVGVDRPGFMLNPTNCTESAVASTIVSDTGGATIPASRFQVGGCGDLAFKPRLYARLFGGTKRGSHPRLRAVLKARPGHANVGRVALTLPRSELFDQNHVRSVCRQAQFAAGACPRASVYGSARAFSPLLDRPLGGPVYLRASNHRLPDLVADLHGQVEIELAGRIDSVRGGIRATFATAPDAPVSAFVLNMKGGKRGLLVNSTDVCRGMHRARARFTGHNGKRRDLHPRVRANCRGKRHRKRPHRRAARVNRSARIAQLVEHFHGKEGVTSSSLVPGFACGRRGPYGSSPRAWLSRSRSVRSSGRPACPLRPTRSS